MRILIDEDTAVQLIGPLQHVLIGHQVKHIHELSWKGKKDRNVLPDAKTAGYQVLITKDRAQLSDPRECDAIKKSGLHHVRYEQRVGEREVSPWPWLRSSRPCPWSCRNWRTPTASGS